VKSLLVISAVAEVGAGVGLVAAPSALAKLLLGAPLDAPAAVSVARIAGAAVLALAIACWSARDDIAGRAARGIIVAMLLYNCGAVAALVHAATAGGLHGIGLWPTAALHTGLAVWCVVCLAARCRLRPDLPAPTG
jgi:hypothetical protein